MWNCKNFSAHNKYPATTTTTTTAIEGKLYNTLKMCKIS
jgi:hypothetical protein